MIAGSRSRFTSLLAGLAEGVKVMETLKQVLMRRDDLTGAEADEAIAGAKAVLQEYLDEGDFASAHDICEEMFGLEPDYLDELIY